MSRITFEVEGTYEFPLDMLRYDRCYPILGIGDILGSLRRPYNSDRVLYRVKLRCDEANQAFVPCIERWRSFGWYVVEGSIQVEN